MMQVVKDGRMKELIHFSRAIPPLASHPGCSRFSCVLAGAIGMELDSIVDELQFDAPPQVAGGAQLERMAQITSEGEPTSQLSHLATNKQTNEPNGIGRESESSLKWIFVPAPREPIVIMRHRGQPPL